MGSMLVAEARRVEEPGASCHGLTGRPSNEQALIGLSRQRRAGE